MTDASKSSERTDARLALLREVPGCIMDLLGPATSNGGRSIKGAGRLRRNAGAGAGAGVSAGPGSCGSLFDIISGVTDDLGYCDVMEVFASVEDIGVDLLLPRLDC